MVKGLRCSGIVTFDEDARTAQARMTVDHEKTRYSLSVSAEPVDAAAPLKAALYTARKAVAIEAVRLIRKLTRRSKD